MANNSSFKAQDNYSKKSKFSLIHKVGYSKLQIIKFWDYLLDILE